MTEDQLLHSISRGESQTVEFKTSFNDEAAISLVAFSNAIRNWIEKYGSGINRIRNFFKEAGLPEPTFELISEGFQVTVFSGKDVDVTDNVTEDVTGNVTENRSKLILELMKANNKISTSEIAEKLHVTRRTIHRDLEKLKISGTIERVGADKGGYWKVKDEK